MKAEILVRLHICVSYTSIFSDQELIIDYKINLVDFFFFFCLFRVARMAYGGSQARGPIGVVATGLRHSHSNVGSKPCLQPAPQLMAMPNP